MMLTCSSFEGVRRRQISVFLTMADNQQQRNDSKMTLRQFDNHQRSRICNCKNKNLEKSKVSRQTNIADRSIELKRAQKGLWQYQTRSKTENNKHCCRFCQNCEWHSKVVAREEKNKKCIVPTTSTANKELCFTGIPQHWSFFADININRLSLKLPFQIKRYVY